ncbi:hypothetical protein PJP13_24295 [Mycobacterium kansasii]
MSDVRAKLAEALRGHQRNPYGQHDGWWECSCSADEPHTPEHLADVLLSLEGVAIVALPEQMVDRSNVAESIKDRPMWEVGGAWTSLTNNAGEIEFEADSQNTYGCLSSPNEARELAAVLLAAADAAEAVKQ